MIVRIEYREEPRKPREPVSNRQKDVLMLLCEGLVYKEIASRLGISTRTVHTHMERIFKTLGIAGIPQAVRWAAQHELMFF